MTHSLLQDKFGFDANFLTACRQSLHLGQTEIFVPFTQVRGGMARFLKQTGSGFFKTQFFPKRVLVFD